MKQEQQQPLIAVITTVLNEEKTILGLLCGLRCQTLQPAEVIIVDGGSTDQTVQLIKAFKKRHQKLHIKLIIAPGNRSYGRNQAITAATHNWIAITDAGCIPQSDWLEQLWTSAQTSNRPVVAGYYRGGAQTSFEQAVVPYMLVMPDRVDPDTFLPATRSMLLKKEIWEQLGGFNEQLQLSEDYEFAQKLRSRRVPIAFTAQAVVIWKPDSSIAAFFKTVTCMAEYDVKAGLLRWRAWTVFVRYSLFIILLFIAPIYAALVFGAYLFWAVFKNSQYLATGWWWLPILQLTADLGVMVGIIRGIFSQKVNGID